MIIRTGIFFSALALLITGCGKDPVYTDRGTFTDARDNHEYKWVQIGEQIWMAENLAYLPSVSPPDAGPETSAPPAYYVYDYQGKSVSEAKTSSNFKTYGVLYNWEAALAACPSGWHLPADEEWTVLSTFLGPNDGGKMKETGTKHWSRRNMGATNESGFTALPGGERIYLGGFMGVYGGFSNIGDACCFWSATEHISPLIWNRYLYFEFEVMTSQSNVGNYGMSVRCVKD